MKVFNLIGLLLLLTLNSLAQNNFLVAPYLQLGTSYNQHQLTLIWHTEDTSRQFNVELKTNDKWHTVKNLELQKMTIQNKLAYYSYSVNLPFLMPGLPYDYRIKVKNKIIFQATATAPKNEQQSYSFIAIGDIGAETPQQKKIAKLAYDLKPDFLAIPGDIVYDNGLISEYKNKFWPIYNANQADSNGAPLMRAIPFVAAVGNHDADNVDLDKTPDALAYYYFFANPLNGPVDSKDAKFSPPIKGSELAIAEFKNNVGAKFPVMNNYSFNYGNAHWTVIDADNFVDWTNKELVQWVENDLINSKDAVWHFVLFHHPGFSSSSDHFEQQQMRALAPVFEKGNVDIVFNGHVHNYQRSYPLYFKPDNKGYQLVGGKDGKTLRGRVINGIWKLDKSFDGNTNQHPNGVIYLVTGAGGNDLYNPEQTNDPDTWQKFTNVFNALEHSLSYIKIDGKHLTCQQIGISGKELDRFEIVK